MIWNFFTPGRTTYGNGSLRIIVDQFESFEGSKPLFVLSERTLNTNKVQNILQLLGERQIPYGISTNVAQEAPESYVAGIFSAFQENNCDSLIAIGGGSVIDLAKAAAILTTNGGSIGDYYGLHTVPLPTVAKILIPTTAGTGSEATNIIVLSNKEQKSKKGIVSHYLFAEWTILDPELTYSMPENLVLSTGLDAFCQCVEAYTSKAASHLVDMHALMGMQLISRNIKDAMSGDKKGRDAMSLAAYLSGIAITAGNSGTNLGHALGNTIGGIYGSPHGISVTAVLEQVLKFNSEAVEFRKRMDDIKTQINLNLLQFVEAIREEVGIPGLSNLGVRKEDVGHIAQKVISDQQRLLANNARSVSQSDVEDILNASL
ncbi:MAG: iron-containing alcohol dehydrogenase family protein [Planctomycetota bacterium]|jgi:alcohol dehydrogenase class IV